MQEEFWKLLWALDWVQPVVKPVLLIRGENNESDEVALTKLGIASLIDPYIEIKVADDTTDGERLLSLLESAQGPVWLLATSVNAMKFWGQTVGEDRIRKAISVPGKVRFAAVGETTAKALRTFGADEIIVPQEATGQGLADVLIDTSTSGHALIPGGNLAMKTLPSALMSAGWQVSTAVVYTTSHVEREPMSAQLVRDKEVSAILFRSPSAVRALTHFVAHPLVPLVCAGVTTARALQEQGLKVAALAANPSSEVVASTVYSLLCQENI